MYGMDGVERSPDVDFGGRMRVGSFSRTVILAVVVGEGDF